VFKPPLAFQLGWLVAQIGQLRSESGGPGRQDADPLPTLVDITAAERLRLAEEQVDDLLRTLEVAPPPPGDGEFPTQQVWQACAPPSPTPPTGCEHLLRDLDVRLLQALALSDRSALHAYELGVALRQTCFPPELRPGEDVAHWLRHAFARGRTAAIHGWLRAVAKPISDAEPSLSERSYQQAAAVVARSLEHWTDWLDFNAGRLNNPAVLTAVTRALQEQSRSWRGLLAGEEPPSELLTIETWEVAGESIVRTGRRLAWHVLRVAWPAITVVLGLTVGLVVLAFVYAHGTAKAWSTIGSIAAGFGITGTSVRNAAKGAATLVSQSLRQMAEKEAMAWGATWLPAVPLRGIRRARLRARGVLPPRTPSSLRGVGSGPEESRRPTTATERRPTAEH